VSAEDIERIRRWREHGLSDREATTSFLSPDVEWVVPRGTLHGVDEVRRWYAGELGDPLAGPDNLDLTEERGDLEDLGGGRVAAVNRVVYTSKESGELAYVKRVRLTYTIRDGMIVRYEVEQLPEENEGSPD
jgi:ketosteroid isomerase-like protein